MPSSQKTPAEIADEIINLLGGNGLSTNQSRALIVDLLTSWKTEREDKLHYQLVNIKSFSLDPAKVQAAREALKNA